MSFGGPNKNGVRAAAALVRGRSVFARPIGWFAVLALAPVIFPSIARAELVLNELLYDPDGPDAGAEWIEILNTGPWPVALDDLAVDSGDGAAAGRWTEIWRGEPGGVLGSGGFLWVGGPYAGRPPQVLAALSLQNGPDAARLRQGDWVLDRVAWGAHTYGEYPEGAPTATTGSGRSLARGIDGRDSDHNESDWIVAEPTPGRPNRTARDVALRLATGRPLPRPTHAPGSIGVSLTARGFERILLDEIEFFVSGQLVEAAHPPLEQGDVVRVDLAAPRTLPAGPQSIEIRALLPSDGVPENDVDSFRIWLGPPALELSELFARPDSSQTEWIELTASGAGIDLAGWRLEDAGGGTVTFGPNSTVAAGEVVLATKDPGVVAGRALEWTGSWPSLNDTAGEGGVADSVFLSDPEGRVVDWAVIGKSERGRSWVRVAGPEVSAGLESWRPSRSAPSPGVREELGALPPPQADESTKVLSLVDHPAGAWFRFARASHALRYRAEVIDLAGRVVWRCDGEFVDADEKWVLWDGRDERGVLCAAGVYVVECRTDRGEAGTDGADTIRESVALVLAR